MKMFLNALKWRIVERIDELIELSDVELDAKYPKFIEQMQKGKGYLRGADPLNRPMSVVNTRLHHKSDQPAETIHRFTLFVSFASFFFFVTPRTIVMLVLTTIFLSCDLFIC